MKRDVDLAEISDGRLYTAGDLVRTDTGGCRGCSECCRVMTDTIILDPWDVLQITEKTGKDFDMLMAGYITLSVIDGLILPMMAPAQGSGACVFLDGNGRCAIHDARPGFCRLFPLGRYYMGDDFRYFLQVHECPAPKSKIKIRKWLGIVQLDAYEAYIREWHAILNALQRLLEGSGENLRKQVCLRLLTVFYRQGWEMGPSPDRENSGCSEDKGDADAGAGDRTGNFERFLEQFHSRLARFRREMSIT